MEYLEFILCCENILMLTFCNFFSEECSLAMLSVQPDLTQSASMNSNTLISLPNSELEKLQMTMSPIHQSCSFNDDLILKPQIMKPNNLTVTFSPTNGIVTHIDGYDSPQSQYTIPNGGPIDPRLHQYVPLVGPSQHRIQCNDYNHRTHNFLDQMNREMSCCRGRSCMSELDHQDEAIYQEIRNRDSACSARSHSSLSEESLQASSPNQSQSSPYQSDGTAPSIVSALLPPYVDTTCVAWGMVTHRGGRLVIPEAGKKWG